MEMEGVSDYFILNGGITMDENKKDQTNLEDQNEDQGNQKNDKKKKKHAKKGKLHLRNPFYREPVEEAEPEKDDETEEESGKTPFKQRLKDFARGAGTAVLVAGAGLVAYGTAKKRRDEENAMHEEALDADSEENRVLNLPEPEDESEDEDEKKKKKQSEEESDE